ncbi:unnamed protein product [Oikopleura dioica]|uniref:Uncharacterized protein n=1 Tax=Oikopleura dioica TaxID=34765 RepID=E4XIZ7_OIKDI|nr:unnamed protein product [Oikopleura dioica]
MIAVPRSSLLNVPKTHQTMLFERILSVFKSERTICSFWLNTAFHSEKEILLKSCELDWNKIERDWRDRVESVAVLIG